jgi:hypothetical protein
MATAKTPKTTPVKPAAVKPAAKPAVAKAASAAKTPEDAVVHSTEVAAQAVEAVPQAVEAAAAEIVQEVAKPIKAAAAPIGKLPKETEEKMLQSVETFLEFGRDNAILLVSTGNELALGWHKLSLSLLDWSAESCDKGVAGASALFSANTVEEVLDLSQEMARDGLQQMLKESSEISTLSTKLFENTVAPLAGRMVANVEKLASHTH